MKKRNFIILGSVGALLAFGWFSSLFVDWPIDFSSASGDISKASRFSREMESEKLTNMEELLKTDTTFKDGIVVAQMVMQTRAVQFGALVDMSNQVAGKIPAFAEVLKEMNATLEMVNNVANSLLESGNNLEAALSGKECSNLEQTTINASLAYTTLQKQNKLANKFIDTTDKYLKTAKGDDHLKFVRDQWVDYQKMTAALDGDKDAAEAMAKKGNLLSGEKALVAMANFGVANQVAMVNSAYMTKETGVDASLASALSEGALENVVTIIRSAAEVFSNTQGANATNSQEGAAKFYHQVGVALNQAIIVASNAGSADLKNGTSQKLIASNAGSADLKNGTSQKLIASYTGMANLQSTNMQMMNNNVVTENFQNVLSSRSSRPSPYGNTTSDQLANKTQHTQLGNEASSTFLCSQASEVIRATAAGEKVALNGNQRYIDK